jgi:two-component system alkaline phosphatase synthesis response regulator PhoP
MATSGTLLCIHRDPAQLSFLEEHGYELLTAANGHEGLNLFRSRTVDAIVLEYQLGLLDGATVAEAIKRTRPELPIVMLADNVELPSGALNSVDALVADADGPHFLLATVHFVLNVKRRAKSRLNPKPARRSRDLPLEDSLTPQMWKGIRKGDIQF